MATLTKVENLVMGRGKLFLAVLDANLRPMGERDIGNCNSFSLTVETTTVEHFSNRTRFRVKDKTTILSVAFNGGIEVDDCSKENLALVIAGSISTLTQAATPITNERIYNAESDRYYQLGTSSSALSGVRDVSAVTVKLYELVNAGARANSTAVTLYQIVKSGTDVFLVTTAGTTAGSAPTYDVAALGNPTTDGTAVFSFLGTTAAFTVTTHYVVDTDAAKVGIVAGGALGLLCAYYTTTTGLYLSLNVDYTPAVNTREQIATGSAGSTTVQLRYEADNTEGDNRDVFIPSCTVSVNGDLQFISGEEYVAFNLAVGVNEKDSNTPQVLITSRPV